MSLEDVKAHLVEIVRECAKQTEAKPKPLELQRGIATIPLKGIDVPFHSTFLRSGVKPFRSFLLKKINKTSIDPSKLVGKYIPNVTAKPFEISKEYFEEVYRLTNSPKIGNILANVGINPSCEALMDTDSACSGTSTKMLRSILPKHRRHR